MAGVKVLDGGFSTQLSTHVGDKIDGDPLWTARYLVTSPDAVLSTHLDFLRAGADIIQTNTYQASVTGFAQHLGSTEQESLDLINTAVELTIKAVDQYHNESRYKTTVINRQPLIAGSCGPYGASLHDGSEYTGDYAASVSKDALKQWHEPRMRCLVNAGVDMLALETIPVATEAEALIELLREFPNIKAWLSFSCDPANNCLADGTPFSKFALECYQKASPGQLLAIGVNCIAPQHCGPLLKDLNRDRSQPIPLVVYPNSGEKYSVQTGWRFEGETCSPEVYVHDWLDLGAKYIGGCCRTYAAHLPKIRERIRTWTNKHT